MPISAFNRPGPVVRPLTRAWHSGRSWAVAAALLAWLAAGASATAQTPDDNVIDSIRALREFSAADQDRISRWLDSKIEALSTAEGQLSEVERGFIAHFNDGRNTPEFRSLLIEKFGALAQQKLGGASLATQTAFVLIHTAVVLNKPELIPVYKAGLSAGNAMVRLKSCRGLVLQRSAIIANDGLTTEIITALREAGLAEKEPVALSRIYEALGMSGKLSAVVPAYLAIFDQRLAYRRGPAEVADGAEIEAYRFFLEPAVRSGLDDSAKAELVRRLAVFFRLDADRYNDERLAPPAKGIDLHYAEKDSLTRMLIQVERLMVALVGGGKSARISGELESAGWERRAAILNIVYEWVGDPATETAGVLNAAPWNVDIGAP